MLEKCDLTETTDDKTLEKELPPLQEMLGIEEAINIKIHIAKIVPANSDDSRNPKGRGKDEKRVLFRGIEYGNT